MLISRSYLFVCLFVLVLVACNNNNGEEKNTQVDKDNQTAVQPSAADDKSAKANALKYFDGLEKLFDNSNYLFTEGKDSSYLYFSRLNNYLILTHSYKMVKGDSADLKVDSIKLSADNKIVWSFHKQNLSLKNNTDFIADWNVEGELDTVYQFQKIDKNTIRYLLPSGKNVILKKTITLSTFLVRSFYDYQHGTKLAFDSTNFTKKK